MSSEYFPEPEKQRNIKISKKSKAFSFLAKESPAWATNIFKEAITENQRIFNPKVIKIGAINSAKEQRINDTIGPIPMGSPKLKSPYKILINFP